MSLASSREKVQPQKRLKRSHIFQREALEHYVEPHWVSIRLFEIESFDQTIWDPCCGWGRVAQAAANSGYDYRVIASDVVDRGAGEKVPGLKFHRSDFLRDPPVARLPFSIAANPPFNAMEAFVERALELGTRKFALLWRLTRMPAARWLRDMPLARVHMLNPRPSIPPGSHIEAGGYVGSDSHDYAWLVFERGHNGRPEVCWLLRDGDQP